MGLDMYAIKIKSDKPLPSTILNNQVPQLFNKITAKEDIGYWRKFHNLHYFIEDIFHAKYEDDDDPEFNCDYVELSNHAINAIEEYIFEQILLKDTSMAFYKKNTKNFIDEARIAISAGYQIYYHAWY